MKNSRSKEKPAKDMKKKWKVRRKSSLCFLRTTHQAQQFLPNNAVEKQIAGLNTDNVTECVGVDKGGYSQARKILVDFSGGSAVCRLPALFNFQKISLLWNIRTAYGPVVFYWLYAVSLLFFVPTFPSVACFRCRRRPLYRREREKVFGQNTLRRRKILPETACRPTFSLSMKSVLTSMGGEEAGDHETVVLLWTCAVPTSSCHQLIHILGDFVIGHFGIALRGPDIRVPHHLADALDWHTCRKRQGSERMSACVVAEILFHTGQYAYLVDAVPKSVPVGQREYRPAVIGCIVQGQYLFGYGV